MLGAGDLPGPMTTRLALIRGINVGGHRPVLMADLRGLLARLGLAEPRSLLQSGNLAFRSEAPPADLERLLESQTEKCLGLRTDYFVRTGAQWTAIIAGNPFAEAAASDPGRLVVLFFKQAPAPANVAALQAAIVGRETFEPAGRQAYVLYPDGIGRSRLTPALIETKLGVRATGRNWNTVQKLGAL
jgi:uncharacterized protein (DUF1697 family)